MKKIILVFTAVFSFAFISCSNNSYSKEEQAGQTTMKNDDKMAMHEDTMADKEVKKLTATFTVLDPGVSTFMKSLVQNYLAIKNALTNSNESQAASVSGKMYDALKVFDKSLLTTDQKKVYDDIEDDLKENAEHISKSKIEHQREHFAMMSEDMYDMVKAFGAGMTLYHDHCPMYNKGSMWLSESKEIRNPYYGEKMMTCGSVEEMFQ